MLFAEIAGQEKLKRQLIRTVRENRISHARLFLSPEGAGGLALAIAYAQYISCPNRNETDSCGQCPSCNKYGKLIHPDLHFVFPVIKSGSGKTVSDMFIKEWRETLIRNPYLTYSQWLSTMSSDNKQGSIFVDESREILSKLSLKSYEGGFKIVIIWMAEKMNIQAANKLLKILEEPPEKTLFVLIAESSDLILSTILSRTQLVKIPKVDIPDLTDYLVRNCRCNEQQARDVAMLSNGNLAKAMAILQSETEQESLFLEQFMSMMRLCWAVWGKKQSMLELIDWSNQMASMNRESQKAFLLYGLRMVRENFMLNCKQPQLAFLTKAENDFSSKFYPYIHPGNIAPLTEELSKAHYHIESNGNTKIIFLDMACKIVMLLRH
ncbi:MAG: DNA polymerase III subunit [Bacteroidales bacterium]|jgi:DNA polymerase-3 subunit delta'|nr:DNA polymerase III subunit [Bacteroidales bacterium]